MSRSASFLHSHRHPHFLFLHPFSSSANETAGRIQLRGRIIPGLMWARINGIKAIIWRPFGPATAWSWEGNLRRGGVNLGLGGMCGGWNRTLSGGGGLNQGSNHSAFSQVLAAPGRLFVPRSIPGCPGPVASRSRMSRNFPREAQIIDWLKKGKNERFGKWKKVQRQEN